MKNNFLTTNKLNGEKRASVAGSLYVLRQGGEVTPVSALESSALNRSLHRRNNMQRLIFIN